MYTIQANASGSKHIEVSKAHLQTLHAYDLLDDLLHDNAVIDEYALNKVRLTTRSLIASIEDEIAVRNLLDLCIDVLYHDYMKAFGLQQLAELYRAN